MRTMITAHSGSDGTPDNSAEFVKLALSLGPEAFEVDINKGADGGLYLRHDQDPTGQYRGCLELRQAFELMKPCRPIKINCDLKARGMEREVFELARKTGVEDRIIFSGYVGFDFLGGYPEIAGKVEVFLNIEEIFQEKTRSLCMRLLQSQDQLSGIAGKAADCCIKYGITVLNVHYHLCTDAFINILKGAGIGISAWTVNEKEDMLRLLEKGVRNITTRKAREAVFLRNDFEKRTK